MVAFPRAGEDELWSYLYIAFFYWFLLYAALLLLSFGFNLWLSMTRRHLERLSKEGKSIESIHSSIYFMIEYITSIYVPTWITSLFGILQVFASLFTCALSVRNISYKSILSWWPSVSNGLLCFFAIHFAVRIRTTRELMYQQLLSFVNAIDLLTMTSLLVSSDFWLSLIFLRAVMITHSFSTLQRWLIVNLRISNSLVDQFAALAIRITALIFVFASAVLLFETVGNPPYIALDPSEWNFFNSVYFIFITLTTVGYGDLSASTLLGRISVILFVVVGIFIFAEQTTKLMELARLSGEGRGTFNNPYGDSFIIVTGSLVFSVLRDFIQEIHHPDATIDRRNARTKIVILSLEVDASLKDDLATYIATNPRLRELVVLLKGSPMVYNDLIKRAQAGDAEAVFILSNPFLKNHEDHDITNIFRCLSVNRLLPSTPLYLSIENSAHQSLLPGTKTAGIIFANRLQMDILGVSLTIPGFITLVYNLVKTLSQNAANLSASEQLNEYNAGASKELYVVNARSEWVTEGELLCDVAYKAYKKHGVIIMGAVIGGKIEYDPSTAIRGQQVYFLLVADDRSEASRVGYEAQGIGKQRSDSIVEQLHTFDGLDHLRSKSADKKSKSKKERSVGHLHRARTNAFSSIPKALLEQDWELSLGNRDSANSHPDAAPESPEDMSKVNTHPHIRMGFPRRKLHDHVVVVCSSCKAIGYYIRKVRAMESSSANKGSPIPLLILCESDFIESEFFFPRRMNPGPIYFAKGSLTGYTDFENCYIESASKIVLVNAEKETYLSNVSNGEIELLDLNVLFTWARIHKFFAYKVHHKRTWSPPEIVLELRNESSLKYLDYLSGEPLKEFGSAGSTGSIGSNPAFGSGMIYSHRLPHLIMSHAYSNPGFLDMLTYLISKSGIHHTLDAIKAHDLHSVTFLDAFKRLSRSRAIPLALYRNADHMTCGCPAQSGPVRSIPYLYTCPDAATLLCPLDIVLFLRGPQQWNEEAAESSISELHISMDENSASPEVGP